MDNLTFKSNNNGQITEYKIIEITHFKDKDYIIYEDIKSNKIYASTYIIKDNNLILDKINTEEEWNHIDKVLEELNNGK